ncbi:hypothetical protein [Faecalicoccus pleomorphus]|uniref:hypothetical protein n=1 Tax=Faecalicoccus pleomorphus TaxID=1323 RepID=UPI0022E36BF4|nr:hypothetical protein [Faecalicoccus pleomorphus]
MNKERVNQLINDLKSADFCCHRIIELNMELEVLNHKKLGLSHSKIELTKEQEKSTKPMPVFHSGYTSKIAMLYDIEQKENEILYYRKRLNECKPIELLTLRDQNILFDLYVFKTPRNLVVEKYGYTVKGLYKHIYSVMSKVV